MYSPANQHGSYCISLQQSHLAFSYSMSHTCSACCGFLSGPLRLPHRSTNTLARVHGSPLPCSARPQMSRSVSAPDSPFSSLDMLVSTNAQDTSNFICLPPIVSIDRSRPCPFTRSTLDILSSPHPPSPHPFPPCLTLPSFKLFFYFFPFPVLQLLHFFFFYLATS